VHVAEAVVERGAVRLAVNADDLDPANARLADTPCLDVPCLDVPCLNTPCLNARFLDALCVAVVCLEAATNNRPLACAQIAARVAVALAGSSRRTAASRAQSRSIRSWVEPCQGTSTTRLLHQ